MAASCCFKIKLFTLSYRYFTFVSHVKRINSMFVSKLRLVADKNQKKRASFKLLQLTINFKT